MYSRYLVLILTLLNAQAVLAENNVEKKLFTMEKNYHAENIMVINSHVNDECKFVGQNNDFLDFYWLIDGKNRKEVHPMIRSQIQEKVKFSNINNQRDRFKIRMNDLSELKHDLEDITMEISSSITNGNCQVKSVLKLGPSARYRKLNVKRTYCEVSTNMVGVPNGCKYLELQGLDSDTGESLKVRFFSK